MLKNHPENITKADVSSMNVLLQKYTSEVNGVPLATRKQKAIAKYIKMNGTSLDELTHRKLETVHFQNEIAERVSIYERSGKWELLETIFEEFTQLREPESNETFISLLVQKGVISTFEKELLDQFYGKETTLKLNTTARKKLETLLEEKLKPIYLSIANNLEKWGKNKTYAAIYLIVDFKQYIKAEELIDLQKAYSDTFETF